MLHKALSVVSILLTGCLSNVVALAPETVPLEEAVLGMPDEILDGRVLAGQKPDEPDVRLDLGIGLSHKPVVEGMSIMPVSKFSGTGIGGIHATRKPTSIVAEVYSVCPTANGYDPEI